MLRDCSFVIELVCINAGAAASWFRSRIATLSRWCNIRATALSCTYDPVFARYTKQCNACSRAYRRQTHREIELAQDGSSGYSGDCIELQNRCTDSPDHRACAHVRKLREQLAHTCGGSRSSIYDRSIIDSYHSMVRLRNHKLMKPWIVCASSCDYVRALHLRYVGLGLWSVVTRHIYDGKISQALRVVVNIPRISFCVDDSLSMITGCTISGDRSRDVLALVLRIIAEPGTHIHCTTLVKIISYHAGLSEWIFARYIITPMLPWKCRLSFEPITNPADVPIDGWVILWPKRRN